MMYSMQFVVSIVVLRSYREELTPQLKISQLCEKACGRTTKKEQKK